MHGNSQSCGNVIASIRCLYPEFKYSHKLSEWLTIKYKLCNINKKCPKVYILMLRFHVALYIFRVKLKKYMRQKDPTFYIPLQQEAILIKPTNDPY